MFDSPMADDQEIITLQLGPLSNQVGVHFWALQTGYSSINDNFDSSFCNSPLQPFKLSTLLEDLNTSRRPRTLAVDLSSSIDHGFAPTVASWSSPTNGLFWDGNVDYVVRANKDTLDPELKSKWSVCLSPPVRKLWLEHDIICTLPGQFPTIWDVAENERLTVSSFTQGIDLLSPDKPFSDEVENRLRRLAERCNRPSGIQLVVDTGDAFSGMASRLLEHIADELPKRSVLALPIHDSSLISKLNPKCQYLTRANEMALLVQLEPLTDSFSNGAWLPLDLSCLMLHSNACLNPSVLAAAWDTMTSPIRSVDVCDGCTLDQFIIRSQFPHGRRMLSGRIGYTTEAPNGFALNWTSVNPYCVTTRRTYKDPGPSLWRQIVLRGVPADPVGNQVAIQASTGNDQYQSKVMDVNAHECVRGLSLPPLQSGARLEFMSSFANYSLRRPLDSQSKSAWCQQPPSISLISILDAPGDASTEAVGLQQLVEQLKMYSSRPPFEDIEQDCWRDYMELAQTYLVDAYSRHNTGN
ncbi:hypothetical protein EG68_09353 [Paragonimus skrjabini miyazakii]|uniref:Uncharacterized protein n=1 Tax=Paragonimus skrjabini miyazakii TaxID=59628 RepID=A0A8S9YKZ0_9TREM|nr:hypothetical protein EG68_09353 [Paragonimus skrjabini miyazakii]